MSTFLMKLVAPLGLAFVFLVLAAVVLLLKGRRKTAVLPALLVLLLYAAGATPLPVRLLASLEKPYAGVKVESLPEAWSSSQKSHRLDFQRYIPRPG